VHRILGSRSFGRRTVAAAATIVTAVSLLIGAPALAAAPAPPPNPTDGQINAAANQKQALASRVGALSGQIAQAQVQLQQLKGRAELAEQKVALAYSQLQIATEAARQAKAGVQAAQSNVDDAHAKFVQYVQATYMSGEVNGTAGSLLTASDPSALLEQSALEQYQQQHQVDAIGALQRATVAKSNADAKARKAVKARTAAAANAKAQKQAADAAVASAKAQEAALQQSMAASQRELEAAQSRLADLNNQRAAYLAYKAEQARLARIRAERLRQQRLAQARAAAAAAAAAARRHHNSGGGGGGGGGGSSSGFSSGGSAPSGGSWSAAKGSRAVSRAMSQLGRPYAWAGGGQFGPSTGVCDASNGAPNDCFVSGFDCSGLAMYAWGKGWAHYAATQFTQAGSYHPGPGSLRKGDLIFWSSNGRISGIHHVAIYKGNQQIIEAPFSGGFVQVAPLYEYGSFFGATRPLT
jgi:cell wall-associated NlpC family hydrolase